MVDNKVYGIKNIYRYYKKHIDNPIEYKLFRKVWEQFVEKTLNVIILEGKDFVMPFRLGSIGIRKQKIIVQLNEDGSIDKRFLRPDWKATNELWEKDKVAKENKQLVFHLNKHFGGFNCKWFWDKSTCSAPNQTIYSLVMTRANKRKLSQAIFDEELDVDYFEQRRRYYERKN